MFPKLEGSELEGSDADSWKKRNYNYLFTFGDGVHILMWS